MAGCWPMRSSETCWIETAFVRASCPDPGARATSLPQVGLSNDRYGRDVLDPRAARNRRPQTKDVPMRLGMVVEDPGSGFVGEIMGWENGLVILEDRRGKRRSFPVGPGFWLDGKPVALRIPPRTGSTRRYDAELVEKIWGGDLRHVGVVVEYLGGIDDLVAIVAEFQPEPGRRLGVLVDHLVSGSKATRIAQQVAHGGYGDVVQITGHRFIDIWQAIKPEVIGIKAWPQVPRDVDFKKGTLAALGLPHSDQTDIAHAWQSMLGRVHTFRDLDPDFNREVEKLIDFVTQDHLDEIG